MLIVDAQVHIWTAGQASAHHSRGRPDPFTPDDLLVEMKAAGVDCAVLAPPHWDPGGDAAALAAALAHPDRFAITSAIDWQAPPDSEAVRRFRDQPGMRGLRLSFNTPEKHAQLTDGAADWIWAAAEAVDLPVMLLIPGGVPLVGDLARRFPGLRLCVDHLGIPRGAKDAAAFEHLPHLLDLAKHANVSVKAGGLPTYSTIDAFPYPSLHDRLRAIYDAFGPERIFWATDLTRMDCSYREVVAMFTEGLPWLSQRDKQLIMGEAVCRWLDWSPHPTASS